MVKIISVLAGLAWLAIGCSFQSAKPDGSGTIECTQIRVAPEVSGRITHLFFQEGDEIKVGQLMARLDGTNYELKCVEARAALAQAQAQLDLMLAGSRDEDVRRAREQVREAKAVAEAAAADWVRIESVFKSHSATRKQYDEAKANAERTAAIAAAAEQQLARLVNGNRSEDIRAARAMVDLAQARLAQAEKALADCAVMAPTNGTVTIRSTEEGEYVAVGSPLATLAHLDEVWLSIYIPETRLSGVKIGQTAFVTIDGDKQRYPGTITFIASEAEFTPKNVQTPDERTKLVYRVKITLPNKDRLFKAGMPADGYLSTGNITR